MTHIYYFHNILTFFIMIYHSLINSYRIPQKLDSIGSGAISALVSSVATSAMNGAFATAANEATLNSTNEWNTAMLNQHQADNKFNAEEAQKARDWQSREAGLQREWSANQAQIAREYDSPVNQVKLLQEAGLNPNGLDYSGSSVQASTPGTPSAGSASSGSSPSLSGTTFQPVQVSNPMDAILANASTVADVNLKESSTHQNYVDSEIKKIKLSSEISEIRARTDNYLQAAKSSKADEDLKKANTRLMNLSIQHDYKRMVEEYAQTYIDYNRLNLDINSANNQALMLKAGVYQNYAEFKQAEEFYYKQLVNGAIEKSFQYGSRSHLSSSATTRQSIDTITEMSGNAGAGGSVPGVVEIQAGGSYTSKDANGTVNDVTLGQVEDDATRQNQRMADLYAKSCATLRAMEHYSGDLAKVEKLSKQLKLYQQDLDMFQVFMRAMENQVGKITLPSEP